MEVWKDIIGYEEYYQIYNLGRIKSLPRFSRNGRCDFITKERILKPSKNSQGYYGLRLKINCVGKYFTVHRLIAIHFVENPMNKLFINHINGIKHDNRLENLEWCTAKENIQHAVDTGKLKPQKGENHGRSKLTEKEVLQIKQRLKKGESCTLIASCYNISRPTIWLIKNNKRWKHIQ